MISRSNPAGVAPPIGRYSHLTRVPADRELLFLAGQVGTHADGTVAEGAVAQFVRALRNVMTILASEGCGPDDIVRINTYAVEPLELGQLGEVRRELLGEVAPSSTLVYVSNLATPEFLVEVEVIAAKPAQRGGSQ
ncbi:RidA family protein [Novosphingobium sp. Gsoil 351]|uniref:RidA family protein n=1 Tax=Novosphingobium sp. Gsoil 351 TaxID=2675225 RepID=UPI0012B478DF|nr:Rid family hydrolase [Novosphingobium sp. Gsoil 351]QGN55455.1 RidA family protein [Novosphingobium sp. Gsoil 351]